MCVYVSLFVPAVCAYLWGVVVCIPPSSSLLCMTELISAHLLLFPRRLLLLLGLIRTSVPQAARSQGVTGWGAPTLVGVV